MGCHKVPSEIDVDVLVVWLGQLVLSIGPKTFHHNDYKLSAKEKWLNKLGLCLPRGSVTRPWRLKTPI